MVLGLGTRLLSNFSRVLELQKIVTLGMYAAVFQAEIVGNLPSVNLVLDRNIKNWHIIIFNHRRGSFNGAK